MPRQYALPKSDILRGRTSFGAIFNAETKGLNKAYLSLRYRLLTGLTPVKSKGVHIKMAFLSPKRLGKAPVRNRYRRQLREAYRLARPTFIQSIHDLGFDSALDIEAALLIKRPFSSYSDLCHHLDLLLNEFVKQLHLQQNRSVM